MERNPDDAPPNRHADLDDKMNEARLRLARTAESIAQTAEHSADVHAAMANSVPGSAEHAARARRLAAAERASTAALRRAEVPPEAARRVIRASGRTPDEPAGPGTAEPGGTDSSVAPG